LPLLRDTAHSAPNQAEPLVLGRQPLDYRSAPTAAVVRPAQQEQTNNDKYNTEDQAAVDQGDDTIDHGNNTKDC
jgi:hypothetical protein